MATSKIKVGDTVRVIAGKSKGKEGKVTAVDRKNGKLPCKWTLWITNHRGSLAAGFCLAYVIFDSLRQNPMFMPYQGWMSNVSMLLFLVVMCAFLYAAYRKEEKHGVF